MGLEGSVGGGGGGGVCTLLFAEVFDVVLFCDFFESDLPKNRENELDLFNRLFEPLLVSVDFDDFVVANMSSCLPSGGGVDTTGYTCISSPPFFFVCDSFFLPL